MDQSKVYGLEPEGSAAVILGADMVMILFLRKVVPATKKKGSIN
jgi:hypothetical protein